jgi:diguanylate cyclase (GGDEF)-like protein/PAS domain S-box-containing protein
MPTGGESLDDVSEVFRAVFDSYPNGAIALYDTELRFVHVGGAVLALLGLTADGMVGSTVAELFPEPIVEAVTPIYRDALAGRPGSVELTLQGRRLVVRTGPLDTPQGRLALVTVEDVTSFCETERQLSLAVETFRTAFDAAPIGMALVGLDGRFLRVNAALCDILGYQAAELLEFTFQDITHPGDLHLDVAQAEGLLAGEIDRYQMEKRYYNHRGHVVWVQLSGSLVRSTRGEPVHFIAQVEDISDRKRREEELTRLARRDPLTGLLNRGVFETDLEAYRRSAERYGDTTGLVLIDLDEFKAANDRGGHEVGDRILVEVAQAIRSRVRLSDHSYRVGGDEFVVLVPHGTETTMAPLAEALRDAIEQIVVVEAEVSYSVGASVGVSTIEAGMTTSPMSDADAALYGTKRHDVLDLNRSRARVMPRTLAVGLQEGEGRESAVPPIVAVRWVTAVISHPPARRPRCSVLGSPPGPW